MSARRVLAAVTLALLAVGILGVVPASAHSKLVSTSPVDGAILDSPPASVSFTFDEPLLPGTDTISVNDEHGNVLASESVSPDDTTISVPWPDEAGSGMFQVAFRVVSGDGHPVTGAITLTITGAPTASSPTAAATTTAAPAGAVEPARGIAGGLVVIIALAVLLLAAVAGITLWRRRPR